MVPLSGASLAEEGVELCSFAFKIVDKSLGVGTLIVTARGVRAMMDGTSVERSIRWAEARIIY